MPANTYLRGILACYSVNSAGAEAAGSTIYPIIQRWAGDYLVSAEFSGSLRKGTAVSLSADADIFISLSSTTPNTLVEIYETLCVAVQSAGLPVRRQNVSIGTNVNGYKIDLVPGRRQSPNGNDHSLWKNQAQTWTQTNIRTHIGIVSSSNRLEEIRAIKIWRTLHNLDFPSIYLELVVIEALRYARGGNLAQNIWTVLEYLRDTFPRATFVDPANTNNVISADLSAEGKQRISRQAAATLAVQNWNQVIW